MRLGGLLPALLLCVSSAGLSEAFFGPNTIIHTANGVAHIFRTELALTPEDQAQGLMYRDHLADDQGMLFLFPRTKKASFWMRNTLIPLDLIFVKRSGEIANIIVNAEPMKDQSLPSKGRVIAVFEVRGGLTTDLGIKAGDMLRHPKLGNMDQ